MGSIQKVILNDGAAIWLPPNYKSEYGSLAIPDPNIDVDTQQKYPVGTRLTKDERAWRYAKVGDVDADGVSSRCIRRGSGLQTCACVNSYNDKLVSASGFNSVGDYKVKLDMTTHVSYLGTASAVAKDDYRGGHFTLYTPTSYWGCRVESNTAEDGDGYVEITLESPLPVTLSSSHYCMLEENMWWKVQYPGTSSSYAICVGFPCIWSVSKSTITDGPVTDGDFIWLQTWGPYEGIIMGNATGATPGERGGYLASAANSGMYPDEDYYPGMSADNIPQFLGFITANNYLAASPVDFDYNYLSTFFLQIAP